MGIPSRVFAGAQNANDELWRSTCVVAIRRISLIRYDASSQCRWGLPERRYLTAYRSTPAPSAARNAASLCAGTAYTMRPLLSRAPP